MRQRDLEQLRAVARAAALRGGEIVRAGRTETPSDPSAKALPGDWVTDIDLASERAITELLRDETPHLPVQGEEEGSGVTAEVRWVVDPLDGTTNFIHGFVAVGVSVALVDGADVLVAATHAPFLGDTWHAAAGRGALWERPNVAATACRVSERPWEHAVIGTGFPFRRKERLDRYLARASTSRGSPAACSTASSNSGSRRGTSRPAPC
jgi:myo-inositol-1(or 4)-monophosphatase